jgi:hypothetical protein
MNHRENALKLRNLKLQEQNAALKLTYDRMLADIEMTESVGCAFAWELQHLLDARELRGEPVLNPLLDSFEAAIRAGADYQEARKWLRDTIKTDPVFKKTAIEAAQKDPNMEIETPFGRYSLRLLTST